MTRNPTLLEMSQIGRNDTCHCGSGIKYKKCCLPKEESSRETIQYDLSNTEIKKMVRSADSYPVERCVVNSDWKQSGLAQVIVIRKQPNGKLMFGVYLVDVFCLGVKNTFYNVEFTDKQIREDIVPRVYDQHPYAEVSLDYALNIVFGAIKYARELGFEPHPDFQLSKNILGNTETFVPHKDIRFAGPEGVPFYIAGPDDRVDAILGKLTKRLGEEGFKYIVPLEV